MDEIRIRSNTGRISALETDVAAIAAQEGVTLPISEPLDMNGNQIENVSQLDLKHGDNIGALTFDGSDLLLNGSSVMPDGVVTSPMTADLNAASYDIENVDHLRMGTGGSQMTLSGTANSINNIRELTFEEGDKSLTANVDGDLLYDSKEVMLSTAPTDLDMNENQIMKSGMIRVGGFGYYNDPPTGDPPLVLNENATITACRGLNFYGSNDHIERSGDELTWGGKTIPTYTDSSTFDVNTRAVINSLGYGFNETLNELTASNSGQLLWGGHVIGSGSSSGVHNPMAETLDANNHQINDVASMTLNTNGSSNSYADGTIQGMTSNSQRYMNIDCENVWLRSTNSDGLFTLQNNPTGLFLSRPATEVSAQGPLQISSRDDASYTGYLDIGGSTQAGVNLLLNGVPISNASGDSHHLKSVETVEFSDSVVLATQTDSNQNKVYLTWGGERLDNPYAPNMKSYTADITDHSGSKPTTGGEYYSIASCEHTTQQGKLNHHISVELTLTGTLGPTQYLKFYLYSRSSAVPSTGIISSSDYLIATFDSQSFSGTKSINGDVNITSDASTKGTVVSHGWNIDDVPSGDNYLVLCCSGYDPSVPSVPQAFTVDSITVYFQPTAITSAVSVGDNILSTRSTGELMVQNKQLVTMKPVEHQTTDDTETTIHSFAPEENTAGLLKGYVYSDSSCFKLEGFITNDDGTVAVNGLLTTTVSNPNNHSVSLSTNNTHVLFNVTGTASTTLNWKAMYEYHPMSMYVVQAQVNPDISGYTFWTPFTDSVTSSTGADWTHIGVETYQSGGGLNLGNSPASRAQITGGANLPNITQNEDWTLSMWVKVATSSGQNMVLLQSTSNGGSPSNGIKISQRYHGSQSFSEFEVNLSSADSIRNNTGVVNPGGSVGDLFADEWRHFNIRFEASSQTMDFVIDGVEVAGRVEGTSSVQVDYPYTSGGSIELNPNQDWVGSIKHLRFYQSKLTVQEIGVIRTFTA